MSLPSRHSAHMIPIFSASAVKNLRWENVLDCRSREYGNHMGWMSRWETHPGRMCTISGQKEGKIGAKGGGNVGPIRAIGAKGGLDLGYRGKWWAKCGLDLGYRGIIWAIGAECGQHLGYRGRMWASPYWAHGISWVQINMGPVRVVQIGPR